MVVHRELEPHERGEAVACLVLVSSVASTVSLGLLGLLLFLVPVVLVDAGAHVVPQNLKVMSFALFSDWPSVLAGLRIGLLLATLLETHPR